MNETEAVLSTDWPKKIVIQSVLWLTNNNQNRTELPTQMYLVSRAVARILCVGGGAVPDPKNVFEPHSGEENCFGLLEGSGGMLPRKIFKGSKIG